MASRARESRRAAGPSVLLGSAAVVLAAWEVAPRAGLVESSLLPPLSAVMSRLAEMLGSGLLYDARVTLTYLLVAFVVAAVTGVVLGLVLGESPVVAEVSREFITFFLSVPKSLFLPLFILMLGIGAKQKIAFGIFSAFAVVVIATMVALASVETNLVRMAESQGATRRQRFFKIYLPSMTPTLLEALRIAMILNITGVLIAEMYVSREGLGFLIRTYGSAYQVDRLLAVIVFVTILSVALNELLRWYERRQGAWRGGV